VYLRSPANGYPMLTVVLMTFPVDTEIPPSHISIFLLPHVLIDHRVCLGFSIPPVALFEMEVVFLWKGVLSKANFSFSYSQLPPVDLL